MKRLNVNYFVCDNTHSAFMQVNIVSNLFNIIKNIEYTTYSLTNSTGPR